MNRLWTIVQGRDGFSGAAHAAMLTGALVFLLPGLTLAAVTTARTNSIGTWNDANWSLGVPTSVDTACIGWNSGAPAVSTATVDVVTSGAVAYDVYVGRHAGYWGVLNLTNTGTLSVGHDFLVGMYGAPSTLNVEPSAHLTVAGMVKLGSPTPWIIEHPESLSLWNVRLGEAASGAATSTIVQVGGSLAIGGELSLGYIGGKVGIYRLTNNAVLANASDVILGVSGVGIVEMAAGTSITCKYFSVGPGSRFTYRPNEVTVFASNTVRIGSSGYVAGEAVFVQDGGTSTFPSVIVGYYWGNTYPGNGVYQLTNGAVLNTGSLNVRDMSNTIGKIHGWGEIAATQAFWVQGRVIANGYGIERDLVLTNTAALSQDKTYPVAQSDGTTAGWYAVNRGRLLLKRLSVAAGASSVNWGQRSADTTPELVNSARLTFANVTGGPVDIALLAPERSDANVSRTNQTIGVWQMNASGFAFGAGSATLRFRYDQALAAAKGLTEAALRAWQFTGSRWVDVTGSLDAGSKTITTVPVTTLTTFAISPEDPFPLRGTTISIR